MKSKTQNDSPKMYVACLAAYNAGHLHGEWINADQEPQEIYADIKVLRPFSVTAYLEGLKRAQTLHEKVAAHFSNINLLNITLREKISEFPMSKFGIHK